MASKILVVDDDRNISQLLRLILEEEMYHVITAENGKDALTKLETFAPDLILLDLKMPVMSGREFALAYRAQTLNPAPILVVSAADDMHQRVKDMDIEGCIAKPFGIDDVIRIVSATLNKHPEEESSLS